MFGARPADRSPGAPVKTPAQARGRAPALIAAALLLTALGLAPAAQAEHEADHRYVVRGFVLDAQRRPLAGQEVSITGLGSARTDSDGAYRLRLHLHNADLGRQLTLRSGGVEAKLRVRFDPDDRHSTREHYANLIGGELVEGELQGIAHPRWPYVLGAIALSGIALVYAARRIRRARRRAARAAAEQHQPSRKRRGGKKKRRR